MDGLAIAAGIVALLMLLIIAASNTPAPPQPIIIIAQPEPTRGSGWPFVIKCLIFILLVVGCSEMTGGF